MSMKPLEGVSFGATYVDADVEADVRTKVRVLGGEFQYSLNTSTDFLLVGKRWADKYNFAVTRGVTLLDPETFFGIFARWRDGEEGIDIRKELRAHKLQPLAGLRVCVSNMSQAEKQAFQNVIEGAGGQYSEAMTARCAVLVCSVTEGRKYNGARKWQIPVVHPQWVKDSVKFGNAIDPRRYDISNGEAEMCPPAMCLEPGEDTKTRRLKRKVGGLLGESLYAKRKLGEQSASGVSIGGRDPSDPSPGIPNTVINPPVPSPMAQRTQSPEDLFKGLKFTFQGFQPRELTILRRTVRSWHGAESKTSPDYVVVNSKSPTPPTEFHGKVITEWALERSLYLKRNALDDTWGRPVYVQPCIGFSQLRVCISGFQGIEDRHARLLVQFLGAELTDTLTKDREVLVAASSSARKVEFGLAWHVPVVSVKWLWSCASLGEIMPLADFAVDGVPLQFRGTPRRTVSGNLTFEQRLSRLSSLNEEPEPEVEPDGVQYVDEESDKRREILLALGESP